MLRLAAVVTTGLAVCAAAYGAARQAPAPATAVMSFTATVRTADTEDLISWRSPERLSTRPGIDDSLLGRLVARDGTVYARFSSSSPGSELRRTFAARPDGADVLDPILGSTEFVLAETRRGEPVLRSTVRGGREALRARIPLRANECAALPAGSEEIWLDRTTLLPLEILERRGTTATRRTRVTYRSVNRALPPGTFAPIDLGLDPYRQDDGFRRTTIAAAARALPYRPQQPRLLPAGFSLAVSGWAPRGAVTGAEGSIEPHASLFAIVYRRGFERIDVTQRLSGGTPWPDDPFGIECAFFTRERVRIGTARGWYATGPDTTPHLYWRDGPLLHTVSGPFPKRTLLHIAGSLTETP